MMKFIESLLGAILAIFLIIVVVALFPAIFVAGIVSVFIIFLADAIKGYKNNK